MGQTERDRAIDVAKGIAIVAIVVGHANRGLSSAGMAIPHVETLDRVLYLCHLTVFAFLSGLFIRRSVEGIDPDDGAARQRIIKDQIGRAHV